MTAPLPLPDTGAASDIHVTSLVAVHAHSLDVDTVTRPLPLPDVTLCVAGVRSKRQGARCDTRTCAPLTLTLPSRCALPSLGVARSSTLALPCPEDGDSEIHGAPLVAVHAHSGFVVTARVPVPPPASIIDGAASET